MKKLMLLFIILGIMGSCSKTPVSNKAGIIVTHIAYHDETYADYYGRCIPYNDMSFSWCIVDTLGKFNVGDTLNIVKLH